MKQDRVLVVDDNSDIREALNRFLTSSGMEVRASADGRTAVEEAARWQPDIILLDIQLPVLDGFEVLEEIKKKGVATRVVMFSGEYTEISDAIRCIRAGACDFFTKPIDGHSLVERLRRYVLLESTINLRVSEPAPIVETLMREARELEDSLREMRLKCGRLEAQHRRSNLVTKGTYVLFALSATYLLTLMGVKLDAYGTVVFFLALFALLLVPAERLQALSAQFARLKARISLNKQ